MLTKFRTLVLAAAAMCGLTALVAPTAAAAPADAQACTTSIRSAHELNPDGDPDRTRYGAVQLRKDTCGNYWGWVQIDWTLSANEYAQAYIARWENGVAVDIFSCDSPGGNGKVVTGQTWCRTPLIKKLSANTTFVAAGHYYYRIEGPWIHYAWGQTANVN